ncbi:uncharacterized protein [Hetaerina americana]|uniref:uncharacterized protein n=1 Tax=Hetaerina americana TaxID=62018 RepID=UPI003A7F43EB
MHQGLEEEETTGLSRQGRQSGLRVGGCYRPCRLGLPPRICHYQFELENYVTMGDACGDCPSNRTACFEPQCITGDGYEKAVLTVNRKIPGPAIHVCRGDIVVVDVHNKMADRATSIHWHGVLQKETPHSDGVPQVTQCAITPGATFRYVFKATLGGTHFWHSHDGLQKMDGLVGNMVVRVPSEEDPNRSQYDTDFREHVILITDWLHDLTDERFPGLRRRLPSEQHMPDAFLLNGLGRYRDPITRMSTGTPLWTAKVFVGVRHKFRAVGVIHYVSRASLSALENDKEPITAVPISGFMPENGKAISSLEGICNTNSSNICTSVLQFLPSEVGPRVPSFSLPPTQQPFRFVIPFGFQIFSNEELFRSKAYYRYFRPSITLSATVNNMSMVLPPSPPLSQLEDIPERDFCPPNNYGINPLQLGGGGMPYRECFHMIRIPLDALVEVLIHPEGTPVALSHPFHLHGYDFQVLRQGLLNDTSRNSISDIQNSFFSGKMQEKPDSLIPPLKDTVVIPPLGFAVIRFRANNPGFWFFHCHYAFHLATGMAIVIQVGEPSDFVPTPLGFPTCGNYVPRLV